MIIVRDIHIFVFLPQQQQQFTPQEMAILQAAENQSREFQVALKLTDSCWDKCIGKPGSKLESSEVTCLANCAERYFDTSRVILQRLSQRQQDDH